ncbi:MAG: glycosyltransferase [Methylicorpusculum sp.]|uniref:glycosyltransferase family 2 protein n=1 Tax=Methylicorpusculum sp. TaxID=2713644 RepID=UPI002725BD96|nr:glycosyltransferase [Methylicorpusculum sp.]MDO8939760.1 glycosyltransferase [Methylicorpusculum sp.]MDP2201886.1 glycosyltransferase [Methylicorpusculum sp.]
MNKVGLIVPTLNAGLLWEDWLNKFEQQTRKPDYLLVIDSSSTDNTVAMALARGFAVKVIAKAEFNHGGTRQAGVSMLPDPDIIVFLTQDALLASPDALERLLAAFDDDRVGAVYGRQLPHQNAGPIAAHARLFNYPPESQLRSMEDKKRYGLKTVFISNSFAAYRLNALMMMGGFPVDTIMNEDTFVAGKMLTAGWKIAYCADAQVFHSHDYRFGDEFKRYFDIGVFHARCSWLQQTFGGASGEGLRYVLSETRYLIRHAPWLIPSALFRTGLKWLGFKLGALHLSIPFPLRSCFSLHKAYWLRNRPVQSNNG